jgi:hypothetical protein
MIASPYPKLGTPKGDEIVGECQGPCRKTLRRGHSFRVGLNNRLLCQDCYESQELTPWDWKSTKAMKARKKIA